MPKFRFKLQTVLEQREREERDQQLVVAALERDRLALEARIRGCQQRMDEERSTLSQALAGGQRVDLSQVRLQAGAALNYHFDAQRAVLELAGVFGKLTAARNDLARLAARKKAVELLREQHRAAFEREQSRREDQELDDMTVMRFHRTDEVAL
ncbi:MAG: flagellar export protein FliJ [Phycisphaerales bacterium]